MKIIIINKICIAKNKEMYVRKRTNKIEIFEKKPVLFMKKCIFSVGF